MKTFRFRAVLLALALTATPAIAADSITDTITAASDSVTLGLSGGNIYDPAVYPYASVLIRVTGTFTATLTFQATADGTNWSSFTVFAAPFTVAMGSGVTTATAAGTWKGTVGGWQQFRVTATAYTSGTATVEITAGSTSDVVNIASLPPLPAGTAALGEVTAVGKAADGAAVAGNPVLVAGQDGTNAQSLATDSTGRLNVVGAVAEDGAAAGNPVQVAGRYDVAARTLEDGDIGGIALDVAGRATVVGAGADGAAVAGNPNLVAGTDGTNAQTISVDSTGRQAVIGGAADGAAVAGNPVLVAGSDGTNAQSLSVDASGRASVVGAAATGAALAGNPVLVAGSDGTNAENIRVQADNSAAANSVLTLPGVYNATPRTITDTNRAALAVDVAGRAMVAGAAADDAAVAGNPVPVGGKVVASGSAPTALTAGDVAYPRMNINGILHTMPWHPNLINCNPAVSTATTLTDLGGSCDEPGAGLSIYVTDVTFGSSVASSTGADSFPTLKYGTDANCGTGTVVFWSAMTEANTTVSNHFSTPIKIPANNAVCFIHSGVGSKVVGVRGFIAP